MKVKVILSAVTGLFFGLGTYIFLLYREIGNAFLLGLFSGLFFTLFYLFFL